jgi:hypothetical protein
MVTTNNKRLFDIYFHCANVLYNKENLTWSINFFYRTERLDENYMISFLHFRTIKGKSHLSDFITFKISLKSEKILQPLK